MTNLPLGWYLLTLLAIGIGIWRPGLRRQMIWAGFLALPVLVIQPLISEGFWPFLTFKEVLVFSLTRGILCFSLAAVANSIYETFWHKYFTKEDHPPRHFLISMLAGPAIFAALILLGASFIFSLAFSLFINLIIVTVARRDLIWDMIFSGLMMGLLYGLLFWITSAAMPGDLANFGWFGQPYGLNVFGVPIEELIAVILFGTLWGPIYVAIKDLRTK